MTTPNAITSIMALAPGNGECHTGCFITVLAKKIQDGLVSIVCLSTTTCRMAITGILYLVQPVLSCCLQPEGGWSRKYKPDEDSSGAERGAIILMCSGCFMLGWTIYGLVLIYKAL